MRGSCISFPSIQLNSSHKIQQDTQNHSSIHLITSKGLPIPIIHHNLSTPPQHEPQTTQSPPIIHTIITSLSPIFNPHPGLRKFAPRGRSRDLGVDVQRAQLRVILGSHLAEKVVGDPVMQKTHPLRKRHLSAPNWWQFFQVNFLAFSLGIPHDPET